jgi:TPR repeat protein
MMLLIASFGGVKADELSKAQQFWNNKDFYKAFQLFDKLAQDGNPNAQLQLGEMYGFGEGTPEDEDKAAYWIQKAAAKGQPEAAASLALVAERKARKSDIAYYTSRFDGSGAAYANFGCARPSIPARSTTNEEIATVNESIGTWGSCYERFIENMRDISPAGKTIKPEIIKLMSNEEFINASALIKKVYGNILQEAAEVEGGIAKESLAWKKETEMYAAENNERIKADRIQTENYIKLLNKDQQELMRRVQSSPIKKITK